MSNDETLSPKAMDEAVERAEAHTREVLAERARRELQPRIDRINAGLRKANPLAAPQPAHVSDADREFAKVLREQISIAPTPSRLAAAEGFLTSLNLLD